MTGIKKQNQRRILVATDFSRPARRAFLYAISLASTLKVGMVILNVIKTLPGSGHDSPISNRYLDPLKTEALLDLGRLARIALEAGISTEPQLAYGQPALSILEKAEKKNAGLIILGTHGRTGWDRLDVGSTAERIVREAPSAVMTVRDILAGDTPGVSTIPRLHRLLVAMDFSEYAQIAVDCASLLAKQLTAEIILVHAVQPTKPSRTTQNSSKHKTFEKSDRWRPEQKRLQKQVSILKAEGVSAHGACVVGAPIEALLGEATRYAVDGIVIGTQGRKRLHRLLNPSVAEQIVRRAGCPVLSVKLPLSQDTVSLFSPHASDTMNMMA